MNLANLLPLILHYQKIQIFDSEARDMIFDGNKQDVALNERDALRKIISVYVNDNTIVIEVESASPYWI